MKPIACIATIALALSTLPAIADSGPLKKIYTVAGVLDIGVTEKGSATVFLCTNFGAASESVQFKIYGNLTQVASQKFTLGKGETITLSTHAVAAFFDGSLNTGQLLSGSAIINATSNNVSCNAIIVNAAALVFSGSALHLVRYNPATGSQE